jgi:protein TonB
MRNGVVSLAICAALGVIVAACVEAPSRNACASDQLTDDRVREIAVAEPPRKTYVGERAKEYRFAVYVDNWRKEIERIGNLNYPEDERRNKIHGSLQLTVGIKADGTVESAEINTSSKSEALDQAAIRLVRLAAPFERLPDDITADTDILYITRTWNFRPGEQFNAK